MPRDFILTAAAVARSSPENWERFLQEFRAYCDQSTDQLISSPSDAILVAQGRTRQCRDLLRLLENCKKDADQIERKR